MLRAGGTFRRSGRRGRNQPTGEKVCCLPLSNYLQTTICDPDPSCKCVCPWMVRTIPLDMRLRSVRFQRKSMALWRLSRSLRMHLAFVEEGPGRAPGGRGRRSGGADAYKKGEGTFLNVFRIKAKRSATPRAPLGVCVSRLGGKAFMIFSNQSNSSA